MKNLNNATNHFFETFKNTRLGNDFFCRSITFKRTESTEAEIEIVERSTPISCPQENIDTNVIKIVLIEHQRDRLNRCRLFLYMLNYVSKLLLPIIPTSDFFKKKN